MAKRPAWSVQDDVVICENFDFMWSGGFSITQKQKNIRALHQSIYEMKHEKALEVSSKSEVRVGKEIGAFSLESYGNTGRFLGARETKLMRVLMLRGYLKVPFSKNSKIYNDLTPQEALRKIRELQEAQKLL